MTDSSALALLTERGSRWIGYSYIESALLDLLAVMPLSRSLIMVMGATTNFGSDGTSMIWLASSRRGSV